MNLAARELVQWPSRYARLDAARRAMYARIDVRVDGRVHGVYSGFSQPAADVTFLDPINAEHTLPQSWFGSAEEANRLFSALPSARRNPPVYPAVLVLYRS